MKNVMTPEQKNLLIAIIAVAAIATGVYFYNKNKVVAPNETEITPPNLPLSGEEIEEGNEASNPAASGDTGGQSGGQITTNNPAAEAQAKLLASFNLALSNGHKEFGKGNYSLALKYYEEALKYKQADVAYGSMFNVYTAQQNWGKAEWAVNKALDLNVRYTEHWKSKLTLLDERTEVSFLDLKAIYENALPKNDARTAINLVTHFAVIAEANGEKSEAIALWEYAKTLNPAKSVVYQTEIDRMD